MFSIQVTEPYSSDYDECLDRAADEKAKMPDLCCQEVFPIWMNMM